MKEPIFVFVHGAYDGCYENLQDALRGFKAIHVINNIRTMYDAEGNLLKLSVKDGSDAVTLSSIDDDPSHRAEFKRKLARILRHSHEEIGEAHEIDDLEDASLDDLVREIVKLIPPETEYTAPD